MLRLRQEVLRRDRRGGSPVAAIRHGHGAAGGLPARGGLRERGPEEEKADQAPAGGRGLPQGGSVPVRDDPRGAAGDPARPSPDGPAGRRPLRHVGPQRPLPARHQPEQPPQEAPGAQGARDNNPQREAHAAGGCGRAYRQRPHGQGSAGRRQPSAQEPHRPAARKEGALPSEPAGQEGRLLRSLGHSHRPPPEDLPVRPAQTDGARAVQAVRHTPARGEGARPEHKERQEDHRARP
ncbi:MAG: hypothetical protein BWY99_01205 [Synergistetes bacterium ADurb.BinA166]|nr:MAG: hypothetical protein BWY99_01205 [Synergistetes bacterium ADurb.BinA166]